MTVVTSTKSSGVRLRGRAAAARMISKEAINSTPTTLIATAITIESDSVSTICSRLGFMPLAQTISTPIVDISKADQRQLIRTTTRAAPVQITARSLFVISESVFIFIFAWVNQQQIKRHRRKLYAADKSTLLTLTKVASLKNAEKFYWKTHINLFRRAGFRIRQALLARLIGPYLPIYLTPNLMYSPTVIQFYHAKRLLCLLTDRNRKTKTVCP